MEKEKFNKVRCKEGGDVGGRELVDTFEIPVYCC